VRVGDASGSGHEQHGSGHEQHGSGHEQHGFGDLRVLDDNGEVGTTIFPVMSDVQLAA
jgi:hypothetical protein